MRYYIIAGEASGDLHGANLMKEILRADKQAQFRFFGGDLMQAVGGKLVKHYRQMAFMGFVNVVKNLKTIKQNLEQCKKDIIGFNPDVVILIDYPGFNLRIAEFAKKNKLKVFYYISPKLWAWKEFRVKKVRDFVDEMFTIFPFETAFYKKHNIDVRYVGNPLLDSIAEFKKQALTRADFIKKNGLNKKPIVALLAGSRVQEVKRLLPVMVKTAAQFSDFQFVLAGITSIPENLYSGFLKSTNIKIIYNQTYDLLNQAHTAIVASGTAALETALFKVPQMVVYKVEGGWLTDVIMRNFVFKMVGVSLPNIIMNQLIVQEFIQMKLTLNNVLAEMNKLLFNSDYREKIQHDYQLLEKEMGEPGCSKKAANMMVKLLQ